MVFQRYPLVYGNIVLDLHSIADVGVWADDHVLAHTTVLAYLGILQDVRDMPDGGAVADFDAFINKSGFMHEI